jgi:peptidyl-prolyl cis-trans isomerase D
MIKILRKHRNWLMIVIAILALPFCLYFVKSDTSQIRSDNFVEMYGRKVTMTEAHRDARLFQLSQLLGMSDLLDGLAPGSGTDDQKIATFIINLIVLRHEAERLGIEPADSEIVDAVRNFPAFKGASGFDTAKYDQVEQAVLPSFGFTDEQLRELARDQLCLKRIKEVVASGVSFPESESKSNYEQLYGKNFVSVVRVHSADFVKEIKVSDDDIKKYYEAHKSELKTEEKRKVEFVRLALSEEQKKLKDKERIDALQKLADRANDFSQALLEKGADFHQVAAKFQLPIETTGEFTTSTPDPKLKADPQLNKAAFTLTPQEPNSDPLQSADGFTVLHLNGIVEARPLTLDEAKQKIADQIKNDRSREMATAKGRQAAESLKNALKSGKPLPAALQEAGGLKPEKIEPFMAADEADAKNPPEKPKNDPTDMMMIKNVSAQLQPGEVSDFVPWIDGGLIILMEKREPPDPAKYQQTKATFEERYLKNAREYVFMEWLHDRQRDAGLQSAVKG